LRVFENRVLQRIFGPKRDEVTGGWKKLHTAEFRNFYCLPYTKEKIEEDEMYKACSAHGGDAYKVLFGRTRKISFLRPGCG
jgi:hypothetical protein